MKKYFKFAFLLIVVLASFLLASCGSKPLTGKYTAEITVENYGVITLELNADEAPITVENFINLSKSGFYNGLTFHRFVSGFVLQGGDPKGNSTGSSENKIKGEFAYNGVNNPLPHTRGAISMARENDYDSASCQFFIVLDDSARGSLDGRYACFGYVTSGMEIIDQICSEITSVDKNGIIEKSLQPVITSIEILEG